MSLRKGGRKPLPPEKRRVKISPAMTPEALETLRAIAEETGETQADILIRLVLREGKRLKLAP